MGRTVLILTGEASGDLQAGLVARELRAMAPDVRIRAVGGEALREAGAELLYDIDRLSAMGFAEVVRQIPRHRTLARRLDTLLREDPPDVVLPVDYPGFNLRIAAKARGLGIPVLYYIGPQVWAWGENRLPKIRKAVDRMLVVFPFEEAIYREAGIPVEFVGHPLLDALADRPGREAARQALGLSPERLVVGLLPGSRLQEVRRLFPVMAETVARVRDEVRNVQAVCSVAPGIPEETCRVETEAEGDSPIQRVSGGAELIQAAADVLLVTSGTATLQSALAGTPLAVLYRTSRITWFAGKRLVKIPHISLVNIVHGGELVPEFLQDRARPEAIAPFVLNLLRDPASREAMSRSLRGLQKRLGTPGASRRVAERILEAAG
ncbi:MAG: lipid-A-disaccharide synthase [Gemmatimonadota bacterium]|nr:lipid-A-disaccharide synthase [Gemmatimonadota bacterium]